MADRIEGLFTGVPGRKAQILEAALDVFSERGYDAGSMRQIASRVGVSEPALYRHFSSKEALFVSLLALGAGRLREETLRLVDALTPEGLRAQMIGALADRRSALRRYAPLLRIVLPAAARHERLLHEYRTQIVVPLRSKLFEKASELDIAFGVPDADATRAARVRALLSLIVGYIASSFVLGDESDDAIVDAALRVMGWNRRLV